MKDAELRKHLKCDLCHGIVTHSGLPLFWRVTVERFGIDARAVQRQHGLAMMLGNPALASVMGPDEDLAQPVMEKVALTMCEPCAMDRDMHIVAVALEASAKATGGPTC